MSSIQISLTVFLLSIFVTFLAACVARQRAIDNNVQEGLHGQRLNKWMVGLSAATTGNSGFIVTGAVGLGYVGGVHWLFLPLSWLLGDVLFWYCFPHRINDLAEKSKAFTISQLVTFDMKGTEAIIFGKMISCVLVLSIIVYTSSQWLAGQKFLLGAFNLDQFYSTLMLAALIISYTSIGGFAGAVYTDAWQSFVRIGGTVLILYTIVSVIMSDPSSFAEAIKAAGPDFLTPFPHTSWLFIVIFVTGYASAALGFGLGQPQIISRYFAGETPEETQGAWWIYIGFLQSTWVAMTVFGILLRGVLPGLADAETGLSIFSQRYLGAVATGVIAADVFATIASTANGLLIAAAQSVQHDLIGVGKRNGQTSLVLVVLIGLLTVILSFALKGNVFTLSIDAVTLAGASVAGPVIVKTLKVAHSSFSLLVGFIASMCATVAWKYLELGQIMNEALIGMSVFLFANWALVILPPFWRINGRNG